MTDVAFGRGGRSLAPTGRQRQKETNMRRMRQRERQRIKSGKGETNREMNGERHKYRGKDLNPERERQI